MIDNRTMVEEIDRFREALRHMYKHAGWSHNPLLGETSDQGRFRHAAGLANAEIEARERGWFCEWKDDPLPYDPGDCTNDDGTPYTPDEVLDCVAYDQDGNVIGSLGGIADPDRDYSRVVEAELFDEALYNLAQKPREARERAQTIASACEIIAGALLAEARP